MNEGLLWFDNSKRDLVDKIEDAATRHQRKFGTPPTECRVNPVTLGKGWPEMVGRVMVVPQANVLRNHFWIGVGDG